MSKAFKTGERAGVIAATLRGYDTSKITVVAFGSHSALDTLDGAKDEGFGTAVLCQKGRERTYLRHDRIADNPIVLDKFGQMIDSKIQRDLIAANSILVPNRSLTTYVPMRRMVNELRVPIFGNIHLLDSEGRKAQNQILSDAGITYPKRFTSYKDIDRLCMVKAKEPIKKIEREFFTASNPAEFKSELERRFGRVPDGIVAKWLRSGDMWIEEFVIGAHFNFNYFQSQMMNRLEFLGIDRRIQTNIDGLRRLPPGVNPDVKPSYIEIGHESATIRESMLEKVYDIGEKLVAATKKVHKRGIIGPFSLQGAVMENLEIVIFDFSPRMPGAPVLYSSPYSKYMFDHNVTSGRRVAMEIRGAAEQNRLEEIVS
ncbi:MAG TPA: DUF1297 domain-containing protein [Candidatus Baltobacteraceae bacterium]|nr:DUF1297 domain-containing protein [Candidatus Baltobacteraceae bacterium]